MQNDPTSVKHFTTGNSTSFTCNECGVSFNEESIFKMHKVTHASDQEPYACRVCSKTFMYESTLRHHTSKGTVCGSKLESKIIVKCDTKGKPSTLPLVAARAVTRHSKKEKEQNNKKGVKGFRINVPLWVDFKKNSSTFTTNEDVEKTNNYVLKVPETKQKDIFVKVEKDDPLTLANAEDLDEVIAKISNKSKSSYTNPDEEQLLETAIVKTEITLGEHTSTISSVNLPPPPPQLTKNEKQMPIKETKKTYRCDECGIILPNIKKLCYHRRTHDEPFVCDICGKSLSRKAYLKFHILHHIGRSESYTCDICGIKISQKNYLKKHMAIHVNKKFSCDECGKSYRNRSSLDAHNSIHSGTINPYTCNECGRSLTSQQAFQRHVLSHSESMQFACDLCDMKFSLNATLYYHKKKHDDGTLQFFSCSKCDLKFTQKSKLRSHYRIHRGLIEKPFICGECGASFARKLYLTRHMEKHTRRKSPKASDKDTSPIYDISMSSNTFGKTPAIHFDEEWTVPEITDIKLEIDVGEYECVSPSLDNITANIAHAIHQHQQHLVYSDNTQETTTFIISDHPETTIVKSENSSQNYDSIIS